MWPFCRKPKSIEVNVNIDYEKLAQEIVKAQQEAKKREVRQNRIRGSIMSTMNAMLYGVISLLSFFMSISAWMVPVDMDTSTRALYTVLFGFIAISCGACAVESYRDSDENAQQHFNTNLTLIALIVALVALVKE